MSCEDRHMEPQEPRMYEAIVVDDSREDAGELVRMLRETPRGKDLRILSLSSASELEGVLSTGRPDMLFMDICLEEDSPTGIDEVARLVSGTSTQVVYVSGYDSYHTRAYRTEHACYLRKPLCQADVDEAVELAIGRLRSRADQPIHVRSQGEVRVVRPDEIAYLESSRRLVLIHMRSETLETYGKLVDFQRELPGRFVRCHQSFLVNLDYIGHMGSSTLALVDGTEIPVSRRHRTELKDALIDHVRG